MGAGVSEFTSGDEVYYTPELNLQGAYADYHVADASIATLKPIGLSHVEAAAVPLAGSTAWQALFDRAQLKTGQVVLIHGGAGGVGSMAVQLASWIGAEVFATAGPDNQDFLEDLGADVPINYRSESFVQVVNEVTRGEGVDVVLDTVGGDVLLQSFETLSPGGVVVSIVPENMGNRPLEGLTPAFFKNATLHCHFMERRRDTLDALARLLERGLIEPVVDEVMPLDRAARAHERMETGHGRGKIVLEVEKG